MRVCIELVFYLNMYHYNIKNIITNLFLLYNFKAFYQLLRMLPVQSILQASVNENFLTYKILRSRIRYFIDTHKMKKYLSLNLYSWELLFAAQSIHQPCIFNILFPNFLIFFLEFVMSQVKYIINDIIFHSILLYFLFFNHVQYAYKVIQRI